MKKINITENIFETIETSERRNLIKNLSNYFIEIGKFYDDEKDESISLASDIVNAIPRELYQNIRELIEYKDFTKIDYNGFSIVDIYKSNFGMIDLNKFEEDRVFILKRRFRFYSIEMFVEWIKDNCSDKTKKEILSRYMGYDLFAC